MRSYDIAVMPGDGIGPEVTLEMMKVLAALESRFEFKLETTEYKLGADHYLATGEVLPGEVVEQLRGHEAILFGAIGDPRLPVGLLERGLLLNLRAALKHAVNLRPIRLYPGVATPIVGLTPEQCDFVIVRENSEGPYVAAGGSAHADAENAVAIEVSINTRAAITALVRYGFQLAQQRRRRLTLCHKKNVLVHAGALWQQIVDEVAADFPDVVTDYVHVDAMCQYLPVSPGRFDVIVTDNLFGDIISDLAATLQGGLGTASSANINLDGSAPSMFEPVHGSAPDIAGQQLANPAAAILSAAMCLATLGEVPAALACESAVAAVLADTSASRTTLSTSEFGTRVAEAVRAEVPDLELGSPSILRALQVTGG